MSQRRPRGGAAPRDRSRAEYMRGELAARQPAYDPEREAAWEFHRQMSNRHSNMLFTNSLLAIAGGLFVAFNFADGGLSYKMYDKFQREVWPNIKAVTGIPLPAAPNRAKMEAFMKQYCTISTEHSLLNLSWITGSLSHRDLAHAFFNLYTWHSFMAPLAVFPPAHIVGLTLGSALASSGAWMYMNRGQKERHALGSSGIVSGLLMAVTGLMPMARARAFFFLPAPMIVLSASFFAVDTYFMLHANETGIGHAAHIGGGVFGFVYYCVFFRRYGGFLGPGGFFGRR